MPVNPVQMTIPPPGIDPQSWYALQRKQQLAEILQSESLSSHTPQQNGNRIVPRAGLTPLVNIAAALMANKSNKELDPQRSAMLSAQLAAYGKGGPLNPTNLDPTTAFYAAQMNPQETGKAMLGSPAEQALRRGGTPEAEAGASVGFKETHLPQEIQRAGTLATDPVTKQKTFLPVVAEGSAPVFKDDGNGNLYPSSIHEIAGGAGAAQNLAAAQTAGVQGQTLREIGQDANGKKIYTIVPAPPSPPAPGTQPPAGGPAPQGAPPKAPMPTYFNAKTASPAQVSNQTSGATKGQDYAEQLAANANSAVGVRLGLSELKKLAASAPPNASNPIRTQMGALLIGAGVDPETASHYLGVDPGAAQAAAHQSNSLALSGIKEMTSRGTNFDLQTFMANNPNLSMTPGGFNRLIDYMDMRAKMSVDKQADFHQYTQQPENADHPERWMSGHSAAWNKKISDKIEAGVPQDKKVVRTGTVNGKKVVQYSDGTIGPAQ